MVLGLFIFKWSRAGNEEEEMSLAGGMQSWGSSLHLLLPSFKSFHKTKFIVFHLFPKCTSRRHWWWSLILCFCLLPSHWFHSYLHYYHYPLSTFITSHPLDCQQSNSQSRFALFYAELFLPTPQFSRYFNSTKGKKRNVSLTFLDGVYNTKNPVWHPFSFSLFPILGCHRSVFISVVTHLCFVAWPALTLTATQSNTRYIFTYPYLILPYPLYFQR